MDRNVGRSSSPSAVSVCCECVLCVYCECVLWGCAVCILWGCAVSACYECMLWVLWMCVSWVCAVCIVCVLWVRAEGVPRVCAVSVCVWFGFIVLNPPPRSCPVLDPCRLHGQQQGAWSGFASLTCGKQCSVFWFSLCIKLSIFLVCWSHVFLDSAYLCPFFLRRSGVFSPQFFQSNLSRIFLQFFSGFCVCVQWSFHDQLEGILVHTSFSNPQSSLCFSYSRKMFLFLF